MTKSNTWDMNNTYDLCPPICVQVLSYGLGKRKALAPLSPTNWFLVSISNINYLPQNNLE